jgi:hypothetical protein
MDIKDALKIRGDSIMEKNVKDRIAKIRRKDAKKKKNKARRKNHRRKYS